MSYELHALRGLWVDTESTFGIAKTFPGSFLAVPYREGSLTWSGLRRNHNPKLGKLLLDGHDVNVLGAKMAELKFQVPLHSHGIDLDGDVAPPTTSNWALLRLLATLFGGSIATTNPGVQTTVQAGSTTTQVNVTATHGNTRFAADGVIACRVQAGSSALEVREIESVAANSVTVKEAFSATPVTGTPVNGGITVHLTEDPAGSLQFVIEGAEADDRIRLMGLMGTVKLDLPIGGEDFPMFSFDLKGADWARLGSGTAQALAYSNFQAIAGVFAELTAPTFGAAPRVVVDQSSFALELALTYEAIKTGGGVNNVLRHRRQATRPFAKGSFVTAYQDDTWYTARDNREVRSLFHQFGSFAGEAFLVSVPRVQITDVQAAEADKAIAGQVVSFEARHDDGSAAGIGPSVVRLHFV